MQPAISSISVCLYVLGSGCSSGSLRMEYIKYKPLNPWHLAHILRIDRTALFYFEDRKCREPCRSLDGRHETSDEAAEAVAAPPAAAAQHAGAGGLAGRAGAGRR
eukprot:scaffold28768_cov130-Isochrysis_galbana.AAC.3